MKIKHGKRGLEASRKMEFYCPTVQAGSLTGGRSSADEPGFFCKCPCVGD
jgi:hypothetical protein